MKYRDRKSIRMERKTRPFNIYKLLTCILAIALVVVLGILFRNWYVADQADMQFEEMASRINRPTGQTSDVFVRPKEEETEAGALETVEDSQGTELAEETEDGATVPADIEIPQKNLEWDVIHQVNKDIYAWLYIPGTQIDYPVLQHPSDDSYYLNYNLDGTRGYPGCIYTELANSREFTDFDTVVYGHNMRNGSMFATLHYYENKSFFNTSPYVFLYVGERVLVYEVFAEYTGDDRHILYANDFSTEDGRRAYLEEIFRNADANGMRRETEVTPDDHILTLSTCTKGKPDSRYLVQAKLLNGSELSGVQ